MGFVRDLINREFEVLVEKAKISNNLEYEEIKIKMKDCHDALFILNEVNRSKPSINYKDSEFSTVDLIKKTGERLFYKGKDITEEFIKNSGYKEYE